MDDPETVLQNLVRQQQQEQGQRALATALLRDQQHPNRHNHHDPHTNQNQHNGEGHHGQEQPELPPLQEQHELDSLALVKTEVLRVVAAAAAAAAAAVASSDMDVRKEQLLLNQATRHLLENHPHLLTAATTGAVSAQPIHATQEQQDQEAALLQGNAALVKSEAMRAAAAAAAAAAAGTTGTAGTEGVSSHRREGDKDTTTTGEEQLFLSQTAREILEQHPHLLTGAVSAHAFQRGQLQKSTASNNITSTPACSVLNSNTAGTALTVGPVIASLATLDSVVASAVAAVSNAAKLSTLPSSSSSSATATRAALTAITTSGLTRSVSKQDDLSKMEDADGDGSSSSSSSGIRTPVINSSGVDVNNRYEKCPIMTQLPADQWEAWLEDERTHCRWNLIRHRHRDKQTFARGPTASEWTREFQCDHAGHYRDRKNPNLDPSKKRKRNGSIKCNCPATIKMRKSFNEDNVMIEYYWRHEGHIPDVMEDIKAQRLPQDLKAWIKRRVEEGLSWKMVKGLMTSGSLLLDELHPATKQNIKVLLQSSYAQYANTVRQMKTKGDTTRSPTVQSPVTHRSHSAGSGTLAQLGSAALTAATKDRQVDECSSLAPSVSQDPPHDPTWQLVSLNLAEESIQQASDITGDSQTLAVHTLFADHGANGIQEDIEAKIQEAAFGQNGALAATSAAAPESTEQQQRTPQKLQQPIEQIPPKPLQQPRQPRDMMLEMLRAIAELHKQMELTEEYGTQEDAIHIIESFALPIRLMKETLERRGGNT